jgi:hypothetical protein
VDRAIEQLLAQRWARYEEYKGSGAAYSALVRLGEIINVLRHGGISEPVARKWNVAARQVEVSDEIYRQTVTEAKQNISRVQRMLGVGTTFLYEELMLALTVRVELGLLCEFFIDRGIPLELLRTPLMKSCWKSPDARKTSLHFAARKPRQNATGACRSGLHGWTTNNRQNACRAEWCGRRSTVGLPSSVRACQIRLSLSSARESIVSVASNAGRVRRPTQSPMTRLSDGIVSSMTGPWSALLVTCAALLTAGYAASAKSPVFVTTPFTAHMDDVFRYGIQRAAHGGGRLYKRADPSAFSVMNLRKTSDLDGKTRGCEPFFGESRRSS